MLFENLFRNFSLNEWVYGAQRKIISYLYICYAYYYCYFYNDRLRFLARSHFIYFFFFRVVNWTKIYLCCFELRMYNVHVSGVLFAHCHTVWWCYWDIAGGDSTSFHFCSLVYCFKCVFKLGGVFGAVLW